MSLRSWLNSIEPIPGLPDETGAIVPMTSSARGVISSKNIPYIPFEPIVGLPDETGALVTSPNYKEEQHEEVRRAILELKHKVNSDGSSAEEPVAPEAPSGGGYVSGVSAAKALDQLPQDTVPIPYFDAPLAEKYSMPAEVAYQEALANTAIRRQMLDLQAAGLNPVLGISRGMSGSDTFGVEIPDPVEVATPTRSVSSAKTKNNDANKKDATGLVNIVSGVIRLVSGSSAAANAAKDIGNGIVNILSKD